MNIAPSSLRVSDTADDTFEAYRDAIDLVATLRVKTVLVALFGTLLLPTAYSKPTPQQREGYLATMREQVTSMEEACTLCQGTNQSNRLPGSLKKWLHDMATNTPKSVDAISKMTHLSRAVLEACEAEGDDLPGVLQEHFATGRGGQFSEIITVFCNQLWASIDEKREQTTARAKQATHAVSEMLGRLECIGKHVRLVSLNASVEAAREGDAGRGLAVIATEFKTLAEEIQSLANNARIQIDGI